MKTITVSDEQYELLVSMQKELNTQDNRCTANPIYGFMRKIKEYGIDHDYSDEYVWISDGENTFGTNEELAVYICEDNLEKIQKVAIEKLDCDPRNFEELDEENLIKECEAIVVGVLNGNEFWYDYEDLFKDLGYDHINKVYYREGIEMYQNSVSLFESDIEAHKNMNRHNMGELSGENGYVFSNQRTPKMEALRKLLFDLDLGIIPIVHCKKCGYEVEKTGEYYGECPKCKTKYFNRETIYKGE